MLDELKLTMREKTLQGTKRIRDKTHHSSSKSRKDFGRKPTVRKIQVTTPDSSESGESSDDQNHQTDGGEDETYEA